MAENQKSKKIGYKPTQAEGECILLSIEPLQFNMCKFIFFILISVILAFVPFLLVHWYPRLKRIFYYDTCQLSSATHFGVINYDEEISICQKKVGEISFSQTENRVMTYFVNRYMRYIVDQTSTVQAQLFDGKARIHHITNHKQIGLNDTQVKQLRNSYGPGTMIIDQPTCLQILGKELSRPLYLFLFFSIGLWIYEEYYYYAGILFFTSSVAIIVNLIQMVQLNKKIFDMAYYQVRINTLRNGKVIEISSLDLVPGDVVFLKSNIKIPFQGIILEGSALINECALTGESVPIVKKADVMENYKNQKTKIDRSAYVFEGTTIVQVNSKKKMAQFEQTRQAYGIPVCVTRTNFVTMKGQLIRIILFPKEQQNVFQRESAKFLLFLFILAIITFFGMIPKLSEVVAPIDIFVKFLDLIVITVPPALPVSMAFGVIYAVDKLKKKSIFCIDESRVITGGVVSFCCFDKTGTLTEDFMDFQALIPAQNCIFHPIIQNRPETRKQIEEILNKRHYLKEIFNNMASNHSIIKIQETGELIGDPMQVKLLQFGNFKLNQSNSDPEVIFSFESDRKQNGEIYRRFDFDSDVQRMSVICKNTNKDGEYYYVYSKGSPEIMLTIMNKKSVPEDYQSVLKKYTSNGFRVLAIASKKTSGDNIKTITRDEAQANLQFNGFEVFENKLKQETKIAIQNLKQAKLGVIMITGDNPLTGSNIGYKCKIADKSKKMIICDYLQKKFIEQEFIYHQHDQQPIQQPVMNTTFEQIRTDEQINVQMLQIQLKIKQKTNKIQNVFHVYEEGQNIQQYIHKLNRIAETTNSQFCVTGNAFNKLFEGKVEEISQAKSIFLQHATIYARTKPNDKAKIVMVYQHTGRIVSMCGDGANDCGALKQADVGLSLSQAEASISAPFTSQVANISSMVELMKQCRAGLATNFSLFNIMASYSLVQYTTSIITQIFYAYPADFQYLYWDIVCNFFFIVVIGYTGTAEKLSVQKPNNSLFCFTNLMQILIVFGLQVLGQISMILAYSNAFADQTNYYSIGGFSINALRYQSEDGFVNITPETNILFLFTNFMYIFTLISFTIGQPWKKSFYTNLPFMIVLIISLTYSAIIVVVPKARLEIFKIQFMNFDSLNGFVLGVAFAFGLFIFLLMKFVLEPFSLWIRTKYPQKKWL